MSTASTLTETVSIDYEDFTDNFLRCSTCFSLYEPTRHSPKLLPCSHTVCLACLERIAEASHQAGARGSGDAPALRCPVCRASVTIPQGGVGTLPPSFIINKLTDLMARQRREVVPKCSRHAAAGSQSELMFCESCDEVFCIECSGGVHNGGPARVRRTEESTDTSISSGVVATTVGSVSGHIVIPFSVAIRRMSEILLYKTGLCVKNLDKAAEAVTSEMNRLDSTAERCLVDASVAFENISALVDQRRRELAQTVCMIRDNKMQLLREQLEIIEAEKLKVHNSCHGIQHQVEVRNISTKISDLNNMLDTSSTLVEPRENCFMQFDFGHISGTEQISAIKSGSEGDLFDLGALRLDQGEGIMSQIGGAAISDRERGVISHNNAIVVPESVGGLFGGRTLVPGGRIEPRTSELQRIASSVAMIEPSGQQVVVSLTRNEVIAHNEATFEQGGSACAMLSLISRALSSFGCIRISRTYPALCTMDIEPVTVHLLATATIQTVDYHGNPRTTGGDPVTAELINSRRERIPVSITDVRDGTYKIEFRTTTPGQHILNVTIFDRCIKASPFSLDVAGHINPVKKIGYAGSDELGFKQPVGIVMGEDGTLYVLDTGNSRIKVLDSHCKFLRHIVGAGLEQRGATGISLTPHGNLMVVNWRTKYVTELGPVGDMIQSFTYSEFVEPTCLAVNQYGEIIVGDNGAGKVFMFSNTGTKLRTVGTRGDKPGQFKLINSIYAHNDEIIVCDNRIQAFSRSGSFLSQFPLHGGARSGVQYCGVAVDPAGFFLVTKSKSDNGCSVVEVYNSRREHVFDIESPSERLKRPCGLVTSASGHVVVVDLGNDCLKMFRHL